jgi:hypothetical protein
MFHVLAFDRAGGRWKRGEHCVEDAGDRARAERVLRERMVMSPGRFTIPVRATAGWEVTVEWDAALRAAGMAWLRVGREPSLACLLLGGMNEVAEETVGRSLQEELGVAPGHPLCPAFATVRRDRRRPMLATFRVGETFDGSCERALLTAEWALAAAYFGIFVAGGGAAGRGEGSGYLGVRRSAS